MRKLTKEVTNPLGDETVEMGRPNGKWQQKYFTIELQFLYYRVNYIYNEYTLHTQEKRQPEGNFISENNQGCCIQIFE